MDFSKVKQIKIKEGIVTKIRHVASDTILWQAIKKVLTTITGKPPLTLEKNTGENLVDYKVYGESVQDTEIELYNPDLWQDGFINNSGSAEPISSSSYPNAKYFKIALKQGQVVQFTVEPNDTSRGRIRYIDPEDDTVKGSIGQGTNSGYVTSTDYESSGFRSATLTVLKDVTLAFMDVGGGIDIYTNFSLKTGISPSSPIEVESVGDRTVNLVNIETKRDIAYANTIPFPLSSVIKTTGDYILSYYVEDVAGEYSIPNVQDRFVIDGVTYRFDYPTIDGNRKVSKLVVTDKMLTAIQGISKDIDILVYPIKGLTCTVTKIQLEKNLEATPYEPYGYKVPVKVSGKNLIKLTKGMSLDATTGLERASSSAYVSNYIPVKDLNFFFSTNVNGLANLVWAYNKNKEAIKRTSGGMTLTRKLTSPSNFTAGTGSGTTDTEIAYIRATFYTNASATGDITFDNGGWVQLEDGSQATDYEPYFEPTTENIYLNEPLRKIGDYADYVDFENQKVVRNIKKDRLASFTIRKHATYTNIYTISGANNVEAINPIAISYDSKKYTPDKTISKMEDNYCIKAHNTLPNNIYISDDIHTTSQELLEFLETIDDTIYYPVTPTEEPIELPDILTQQGTNIVNIATKIQPSNMEIKYYEDA